MKKLLALLLATLMLVSVLCGCGDAKKDEQIPPQDLETIQTDVWDGAIATAFEKGDGTESNPYVIARASQFAFLAQEVNAGNEYVGKYFSLQANLDLNNLEWTPIGNGTYSFCGIFDGENNVVSNLKITSGVYFMGNVSTKTYKHYATGLFGSCKDAIVKNIDIHHADIIVQNPLDSLYVNVGVLIGHARLYSNMEISNVTVSDATITCDFRQYDVPSSCLNIGGISGNVYGYDNATCSFSELQASVRISIEDGYAHKNRLGGISGSFYLMEQGRIQNCAAYLSIDVNEEMCYFVDNYFGAFGYLDTKNTLMLSDMFSKVTVNKIHDSVGIYSAYTAYAIAGVASFRPNAENGVTQIRNVFGFVEQLNPATGERKVFTQLYDVYEGSAYNETNCQGCEQLPEGHGFDEAVWNFVDLSNPQLK